MINEMYLLRKEVDQVGEKRHNHAFLFLPCIISRLTELSDLRCANITFVR
jgi:hypothetical protein